MLLAVQIFNNPQIEFKSELFIVTTVIAWTYLLRQANLREWFQQTRGPRLLINGSDVRIGLDEPDSRENCLMVRGFRRVDGEFPPIHIKRVLDDEGEPNQTNLGKRRQRIT